jgi:hypothetical protein
VATATAAEGTGRSTMLGLRFRCNALRWSLDSVDHVDAVVDAVVIEGCESSVSIGEDGTVDAATGAVARDATFVDDTAVQVGTHTRDGKAMVTPSRAHAAIQHRPLTR